MALYQYVCTHCDRSFELLRSQKEFDQKAQCPECGIDASRVQTSFSFQHAQNIRHKLTNQQEERSYYGERRKQEDKSLDVDTWLDNVSKEGAANKKFKKQIEREYGRGKEGFKKFEGAKEYNRLTKANDAFSK